MSVPATEKKVRVFHLYARRRYEEPLSFVKQVEVELDSSLPETLRRHAGDDWLELIAFPDEAVIQVIPGEEE